MALYESGDRKECSKCGDIKSKTNDFSNNVPRKPDAPIKLNSRCDSCRSKASLKTMENKEVKRKEKDDAIRGGDPKRNYQHKVKNSNWYDQF